MRQAIRSFMIGTDGIAGAALVEFTIFLPILLVMSIYTMDFGLYFYYKMQVQNAAQAGVQYAIEHNYTSASISSVMNANLTSFPPLFTVNSASSVEQCGCPLSTRVSFTTWSVSCPACSGNSVGGAYVTTSVQATYKSFVPYGLFSSSLYTLAASATARIQ
jgi:Flp pilus assembly protein TadG